MQGQGGGTGPRTPVWGPGGFTNIAIIGSAPSSIRLAPYRDMSWAIWGCSPGAFGVAERSDVWWELHRWEPPVIGVPGAAQNRGWFSPEYVRFLEEYPGTVVLAGPDASIANPVPSVRGGWRFPFENYVAKYGRYHFQSSMSWMLAHAIELLAPRARAGESVQIGLWGVDMAANTEYAEQRPGCRHFIGLAISLGIKIVLPPESDLMQPPTLYGICEYHPRHTKLLARMNELKNREQMLAAQVGQANTELMHVRGAIDNLGYIMSTWIDDVDSTSMITSAISMAGIAEGRPPAQEAALVQFEDPAPQKE